MDFITDNNPKGITYIKDILADAVPSYIKEEQLSSNDMSKVASSAFADSANREYPINNKVNLWKSAAYFYTQGRFKMASDKAERIEKEIILASTLFDTSADIKNIVQSLDTVVKTASEKSDTQKFAFTVGSEKGYFPINTEKEVMDAASKLDKNRLGAYYYKLASTNIVKRAKELNICSPEFIPENIINDGEERLFNYEFAKHAAEKRVKETGCELYKDIVEAANNDYMQGNCDVTKYASEMFKLDELYGLDKHYDLLTPDPYKALAQGVSKEEALKFASENVLFNDIFIPISEFKKEELKEKIDINFSHKIASEIKDAISSDNSIDIASKLAELDSANKITLLSLLV